PEVTRSGLAAVKFFRCRTIELCRTIDQGSRQEWKILRHDAYDRVRPGAQGNLLADNSRVAGKASLPQSITENNDLILSVDLLLGQECASQQWLRTHHRKVTVRHLHSGDAFRSS